MIADISLDSPFAPLAFICGGSILLILLLGAGKDILWRAIQAVGALLGLGAVVSIMTEWLGGKTVGLAIAMILCLGGGAFFSGCFKPILRRGEWKSRGRRKKRSREATQDE